jgi:cytoskeletal protein CcmA (bactofilin family)
MSRRICAAPCLIVLASVLAVVAVPEPAGAEIGIGYTEVLQGETKVWDLYTVADRLNIAGTLDGDVFALAESGEVTGTVTQDLNVFTQRITIAGDVGDDIRAFGQDLTICGNVGDNVLAFAANANLCEGAVVEGDYLVYAGVATIDGDVKGDAWVGGGVVKLNGTVGGNAQLSTDGGITFGEGARIEGDLHYTAPAEIDIPTGVVQGAVTFDQKVSKEEIKSDLFAMSGIFKAVFHIFKFIAAIIAGSIIVALTKKHAIKTAETIRRKPLKSLGIGFIAFICIPVVIVITLVLVLTIPLSFMLLLAYLIAIYIAKFYVAIWLGNLMLGRGGKTVGSPIGPMLLGLLVIYIVTAIPIVGTLVGIVIIFLGLGALLQRRETRLNGAFEEQQPAEPGALPNSFPGSTTGA